MPFRDTLAGVIDKRIAAGRPPVIVTIHSFTPVYHGVAREVEIGILHDADTLLADAMLAQRGSRTPAMWSAATSPMARPTALPTRSSCMRVSRGLLNVMIEVRNDLSPTPRASSAAAGLLAGWVTAALADLGPGGFGLADRQAETARPCLNSSRPMCASSNA